MSGNQDDKNGKPDKAEKKVAKEQQKHGAVLRGNVVTDVFYHIFMGSWDVVQGKPPTFHNEINKIVEGEYGANPDYTDIADKVLKDLDVYLRDTKNVTAIITSIGMATRLPPFMNKLITLLLTKDVLRNWIDARMTMGRENRVKGIEEALKKAVEQRKKDLAAGKNFDVPKLEAPKSLKKIKLPKFPKFF